MMPAPAATEQAIARAVRFTKAELNRAVDIAKARGVAITLKAPDGREVTIAPVASQPETRRDNEVDKFFEG